MRSSLAIPAVLVLSLSLLGCPAPEEVGPSLGTATDTVTIHLMPAQANSPFTVKLTPPLPALDLAKHPDGLIFIRHPAPGPSPRWDRVAVGDFVEAGTGNPVGTLKGSCDDLGTERNSVDRCRVTFEAASDPESWRLFKYSVMLYEPKQAATEPTEGEGETTGTEGESGEGAEEPAEETQAAEAAEEPIEATEESAEPAQEPTEPTADSPDLVIDPVGVIMG